MWRSLLWGKELLAKGCIWRVGSGENIRIFKDNWVATKNGVSFTNPPLIPDDVSVADLRLANGEWNREFIETLFDPVDVKKFMSVPVGLIDNEDFLAWNYTKNGVYSIRSGYREALNLKDVAESSSTSTSKSWWKLVWSINVPPIVKNFVWRVSKNWIPTNFNLFKRSFTKKNYCNRCKVVPDSTCHSLWTCPFVKDNYAPIMTK